MAQTIVTLCDPCLMEGKEAPASTWGIAVSVPGAKAAPYEIDVCDMHAEPYRVLLRHLGEDGRRADRKRPLPTTVAPGGTAAKAQPSGSPGAFPCPVCGHVLNAKGGLRSHVQNEHGKTLAEVEGKAAIPCVVDDCDRHFSGYQGVASHLRITHGWPAARATAAIAQAKEDAAA